MTRDMQKDLQNVLNLSRFMVKKMLAAQQSGEKRVDVALTLSDGVNYAVMSASSGKGGMTFEAGVFRKGTDRLYSNFIFEAGNTAEAIIAWLQDTDSCVPYIYKCWESLTKSSDDFWSEHDA